MAVETEVAQRIRPLTFDEVLQMAEAGLIGDEERLDLVDGVLVRMSPAGLGHANTVVTLNGMLSRAYRWPEYGVRVNTPTARRDPVPAPRYRDHPPHTWAMARCRRPAPGPRGRIDEHPLRPRAQGP